MQRASLPSAAASFARLHHVLPSTSAHAQLMPWSNMRLVGSRQWQHTTAAAARVGATAVEVDDSNGGGTNVIERELHVEASESYLAYAMSVIVGRALPDVRDGLKPVHRRILFAMHALGLHHNKPFRKCARVVGEVLGKYHPHGDTAVYDALVRMAQDFAMGHTLVSGHGNFGSMDGDPAAAMRYTECRLQRIALDALLADLEFDTVDHAPNFDASQDEPTVLPAKIPNLLVNGTQGIAVGIATKIPPHNLREVLSAFRALARNPDISIAELMTHLPAPDFPTGGQILSGEGIKKAYETGNGLVIMRGTVVIEDAAEQSGKASRKRASRSSKAAASNNGAVERPIVVITEIPYQVNKAELVENIAKLAESNVLEGVSNVRDESDRDGTRIVIEVKRGRNAELLVKQLYKHTRVQCSFACNMVALVDGTPRTLNLKQMLQLFLEFRCQVVTKRAEHRLAKAQARLHLVNGFLIAMQNLDDIVACIRAANDTADARDVLCKRFNLSTQQADGILNMALRRLTSLETKNLQSEKAELDAVIADLTSLLQSKDRVLREVMEETDALDARYGQPRRSQLVLEDSGELRVQDVIPNNASIVMFSRRGYIKRLPVDTFAAQNRGGRGKAGTKLKQDDSMEEMVHVMDHDQLLFFTTQGHAYTLPAYKIPETSRTSAGTAIAQVLPIGKDEAIAALLPLPNDVASSSDKDADETYLLLASTKGLIKKTLLSQFANIRSTGVRALNLQENDSLGFVSTCTKACSVLLATSAGMVIHFDLHDEQLRPMGRSARGVRAVKLPHDACVVGMTVLPADLAEQVATASMDEDDAQDDNGFDALTNSSSVGGDGSAEKDGVADDTSSKEDDPWLLFVTKQGRGKRVPVRMFRKQRRSGMGLIGLKCKEGDELCTVTIVGNDPHAQVILGSEGGMVTRSSVQDIPVLSRVAQGVRVMRPADDDVIQTVTIVIPDGDDE